jgi:alanine-synthesizing transaminase
MFSRRLPPDLTASPLHQALIASRAIDLTTSNPTEVELDYPQHEIAEILARASARLVYEAEALGLPEARAAVGRYAGAPAERVVLTSSTSEAYGMLTKLLCDPGESVAVPAPSYPLVQHLVELEGVRSISYALDATRGFCVDVGSAAAALRGGARALVIVSPNNPTGTSPGPGEWRDLLELCVRHDAALIIDEVFAPYAAAERRAGAALAGAGGRSGPLVFVLDGLSKAAGLPHLKLGWMTLHGSDEVVQRALAGLEWIADSYLAVAGPIQRAAPELLALAPRIQAVINTRLAANRLSLSRILAGSPITVTAPAGWYACLRLSDHVDEEAFVEQLATRHGVLVHPGFFYDFAEGAWLVVSLLVPEARLSAGAAALAEGLRHV